MRQFVRRIKRVPKWLLYILVFCFAELMAVLAYEPLLKQAMTYRTSDAPGGEMLLVLLGGFMAVMLVYEIDEWKKVNRKNKRSEGKEKQNVQKSR